MDLDHLFDFFLATNGISFNIVSFFTMDYFTVNGKVFVPLHGWEYVILYLGIGFIKKYRDISISLSFAIIGHLLIDHISYGIKFSEYFILYRLW